MCEVLSVFAHLPSLHSPQIRPWHISPRIRPTRLWVVALLALCEVLSVLFSTEFTCEKLSTEFTWEEEFSTEFTWEEEFSTEFTWEEEFSTEFTWEEELISLSGKWSLRKSKSKSQKFTSTHGSAQVHRASSSSSSVSAHRPQVHKYTEHL